MISDTFIRQVLGALEGHRLNKKTDFYIPSLNLFKEIFTTAFFTSLKTEEGDAVDFSVIIVDSVVISDFISNKKVLEFDSPVPLAINALVKLSPAHDQVRSVLILDTNEQLSCVNIIGLIEIDPICDVTVIGNQQHSSARERGPENIILSSNGAGKLKVAVGDVCLGYLIDGQMVPASPSVFSDISLGYHLKKAIVSHELHASYGKRYWEIYRRILMLLLQEASARGHGSTIVLLDSPTAQEACMFYESRYRFTNMYDLKVLIKKALEDGEDSVLADKNDRVITNSLRVLAQLATVDGALIMTNQLEFESFGTTLLAPQWNGNVFTGPDGFGKNSGNSYSSKKLGTRHNSAIAFAGKCKGAFVFVISHDGPVRAFVSYSDDTVICWPDCSI